MASHAYLFIKGIEGSCKAEGHEKEVEITKLTQNFSFSKEKIKVGSIDNVIKQNLNFAKNFLDHSKADINEMTNKLIEEFREYKKLARHGVSDDFKSKILSQIKEEAKANLNKKLTEKITQRSFRKVENDVNYMKNDVGLGLDFLFNEKAASFSEESYNNSAAQRIENNLRKNMSQQLGGKIKDRHQEIFESFETNIENLINKIKSSVSNRDPLEFVKEFDKASPKLLEACCTGQVFDECRLMIYRSVYPTGEGKIILSDEKLNNFVHIKFYNAYVTSYSISHSSDDLPVETIKMNYDKVEFKFAQGDPKTGKKGQQKIISWDWTTNKAEEKGE